MNSRIQVAAARKDFAKVMAHSAAGARIKVTRYGQTLAALIPKRDLTALEDCEKSGKGGKNVKSQKKAKARARVRRR